MQSIKGILHIGSTFSWLVYTQPAVMHVPCEAFASQPAPASVMMQQARCSRQPLFRPWRQQAGFVLQQAAARRGHARRARQQQLVPAAAAELRGRKAWDSVDASALVPLEEGLTPAEEAESLVPRRPGYRSFTLDTCEFLIAETPDGRLDLADCYVLDADSEVYARPTMNPGELPQGPRHYQAMEVGAEYLGNVLEDKPPKQWVYKVYLLPVACLDPYELDLSEVYLFEDKTRSLSRQPVVRMAPESTAPHDLRLRFRDGVTTIESVESLPSWEDVVLAHNSGLSALSQEEWALLNRAADGLVSWEEAAAVVGEEYVRIWQAMGQEEEDAAAAAAAAAPPPLPELPDHLTSTALADNVDENLKDFMAEYDDENDSDYEDFDSPAVDY